MVFPPSQGHLRPQATATSPPMSTWTNPAVHEPRSSSSYSWSIPFDPPSGHSSHCPPTCPGERPPSILSAVSCVLCRSLSRGSCPATFQLKSLPTKTENVLSQGHSHLHCDHIQGQTRLLSGLSTQVPSPTCKVNIKTTNRRPNRTMSCWQ